MTKKIEVNSNGTSLVAKKRGRKCKKDIISNENLITDVETSLQQQTNINVVIEECGIETENVIDNLSNSEIINSDDNQNINIISENINFFLNDNIETNDTKPALKKRGRKPKGGKIIQQSLSVNNNKETKPNVILHLKCSLKDFPLMVKPSSITILVSCKVRVFPSILFELYVHSKVKFSFIFIPN
jgi:hypothetical protein